MNQKTFTPFLLTSLLFSSLAFAAPAVKPATFIDGNGKTMGELTVKEEKGAVKLALKLHDIKPGTYAMHIHESGKCESPKFESAGSHFNPTGKEHGMHNPKGAHMGDLPNITVLANGKLIQNVSVKSVNMKIGQPNTLATPEGTSLVIHAQPDDEKTNPSGNSGDRLFCAVISGPQVASPL